jgi:para-nitrobenzyl esterase
MTRVIALSAALVLAPACADPESAPEPGPDPCATFEQGVVELPSGSLRGHRAGDSCAFLGIAYADSTSGERRFRAPAEKALRSAVTDARDFGSPCVQFAEDDRIIGSETCLTLNVWTPGITAELRPVLVFLHGGGNVSGSSADPDHDGRDLASRGGLVVVTPNFRLGALGYLAHPALGLESSTLSSGNYGLLDQIAALTWVRENVGAFGGDPARVLLIGQSAGSRNACALLASPLARGLFSRAALHSGACNLRSLADQERIGAEISRLSGCANAPSVPACLRGQKLETLLRALPGIPGPMVSSEHNPNVDGWLLDRPPLEIIAAGEHAAVPLIVSTNQDEVGSVISPELTAEQYPVLTEALFGADFRAEMLERYPVESFDSPREALVRMITDARYACPARRTSQAALAGGGPVFRSVWARGLDHGPESGFGAHHGVELLFLFRGFERHGQEPTASELALSDRMIRDYARFAATGDPSGVSEPWPAYEPADVSADGISAHCDFWDTFDD